MQVLASTAIPNNVQKAKEDPNWTKAMDEEMDALIKNQVKMFCHANEFSNLNKMNWGRYTKQDLWQMDYNTGIS